MILDLTCLGPKNTNSLVIPSQESHANFALAANRTAKVTGKKSTMAAREDHDNSNGEPRQYGQEFAQENRKVAHDLDRALRSTMREDAQSRRSAIRFEFAKRLQQKIETSSGQILELLDSAAEGREYCEALVDELEYLKDLIDPGNERNRELYTASRVEEYEDEGSEEDE